MAQEVEEVEEQDYIELTEMLKGYDGVHRRLEVMEFSKDVHDKPGVYLQEVEGCGYRVYDLTVEQAESLAAILLRKAAESRAEFPDYKPGT